MEKIIKNRSLLIALGILSTLRAPHAIAEDDLITSDYTASLQSLSLLKAAEKAVKTITSDSFSVICLSHPQESHFVGAAHGFLIHAPLEKVAAALDDFPGYEDLFEDIDEVEVLSKKIGEKSENTYFRVHTEQNIPLPLVPNAHITNDYFITRPSPTLLVYRYQLAKDPKHPKKDDVLHADGVIVLERRGEKETAFFEVDFLKANLSGLAALGSSRIWPDSIKGFSLSDLALKNFVEDQKSRKEARKKARDQLDSKQIEKCLDSKTPAHPYLKKFLD